MFKMLMGDLKRAPLKLILTLLTVSLGTGLLMLALSISDFLETSVQDKLAKGGVILSYANGTYEGETLESERPPLLDRNVLTTLEGGLEGFVAGAPVKDPSWSTIKVDGSSWKLRDVVATTPSYSEVMSLEIIEGIYFTQESSDRGDKVSVISRSLAELLFGSAKESLGKTFNPPEQSFSRRGSSSDKRAIVTYQVVGVFEDKSDLFRRSYDLADMIIPLASIIPQGSDSSRYLDSFYSQGVFKVEEMEAEKIGAKAGMILSMSYGEDVELYFWEGDRSGNSTSLDEIRTTLSTFTVVISILGFILLITSSIGILSIMMVEALGKSREIGLKRALGASKMIILKDYFKKSIYLSFLCALLGFFLALLFIHPFGKLVTPLFNGLTLGEGETPFLTVKAMLTALFTALFFGGVLGTLPLFSLMKGPLSDTIREG